jgi:CheY-like chemotaxis protein/ribonuclease BN (tRNA processing enzyme)
MPATYSFFIVDDDEDVIIILTRLLESKGHKVSSTMVSNTALQEIIHIKPDCIVLDIMMSDMDGFELLKLLRHESELDASKIVMLSSKAFDFDRRRALELGADDYITKPIDPSSIVDQLQKIIGDSIEMRFWGVRGMLPVPGNKTLKYGGNTSCVSLSLPGDQLFVFDAGSGIKALSDHLMKSGNVIPEIKIFISHPHWDHINALPFFAPLYRPGNEIEICGPTHGDITMSEVISAQMDGVSFPINIKKFGAWISFRDIKENKILFDDITVRTMLLNHPGNTLGYRVQYKNRSFCYITDNEIYPESSQYYAKGYLNNLTKFIRGAGALIIDTSYSDAEYEQKINWGHSSVSQVASLAAGADVKKLFLFHHSTDQTDHDIDIKLEVAQNLLRDKMSGTECIAPKEGQVFKL